MSPAFRSLALFLLLAVLSAFMGCGPKDADSRPALPDLPDLSAVNENVRKVIRKRHQSLAESASSDSWRRYARVLHVHGFLKEAADAYLSAAKDVPNAMPDIYLAALATMDIDRGRTLELLRSAERKNPKYLGLHLSIGRLEAEAGDHEAALLAYEKANQLQPTAMGYGGAARALSNLDRNREALKMLTIALQHQKLDSKIYGVLAQVQARLGNTIESKWAQKLALDQTATSGFPDPLMSLVAKEGESYRAIESRVEGLVNAQRYTEALADCERLIVLRPEDPAGLRFKAGVLFLLGRYPMAYQLSNEVLRKHPKDVEALVTKANVLEKLGKSAGSLATLEKALELEPDNPRALYLYGFQIGPIDLSTGIEKLSRVLELSPLTFPQARFFLARLHQRQGNLKQARRVIQEALRFNPQDKAAIALSAELGS